MTSRKQKFILCKVKKEKKKKKKERQIFSVLILECFLSYHRVRHIKKFY